MIPRFTMAKVFSGSVTLAWFATMLMVPDKVRSATPPQPVLVELFTSEGCSSCPPADRLLMDLDRDQPVPGARIVVLSEHVDYWNSLGWRDPFSSAQWSERQSDYSRHFGLDSVYTPQMVVNGVRQAVGSEIGAVRDAIEKSVGGASGSIRIFDLRRTEDRLQISYSADAMPNATLYAVLADGSDRSSVARGENAGRTLNHVAVTRSLTRICSLQTAPVDKTVEIPIPHDDAARNIRLILFAQDAKTGFIVGVAEREL